MRATALLLGLVAGFILAPTTMAEAPEAQPNCYWEAGFAQLVYDTTLGIVHPHDGTPFCTVHLHWPQA